MGAIVVTRHPALVALLIERGIIEEGAEVLSEVTPEQIRGRHVIGVLPLHLAVLCERVTVVPLDVPAALRGQELTLEQLRAMAGPARAFVVREVL